MRTTRRAVAALARGGRHRAFFAAAAQAADSISFGDQGTESATFRANAIVRIDGSIT